MNRMTESLVNWSGFYVPSLANDEIANEIAVELESHKGVRKVECDRFLSQVAILHDADQISRGQLHRLLSRLDSLPVILVLIKAFVTCLIDSYPVLIV